MESQVVSLRTHSLNHSAVWPKNEYVVVLNPLFSGIGAEVYVQLVLFVAGTHHAAGNILLHGSLCSVNAFL